MVDHGAALQDRGLQILQSPAADDFVAIGDLQFGLLRPTRENASKSWIRLCMRSAPSTA